MIIFHKKDNYEIKLKYFEDKNDLDFNESLDIKYNELDYKNLKKSRSRRIIKYNEVVIEKLSEVIGIFNSVIFAPEDLNIIKEGPSTRRRFLDILISQIKSSYFKDLNTFQKILVQRNSLLKQMREKKVEADYSLIEIWDISFAEICSKIILKRFEFVELIDKIASNYHKKISYGKEEISVKYKTISGISINNSAKEIEELIFKKLKSVFMEDIERGNTLYGPHRDDIEIMINGEPLRSFASQGQQRTAVLALKLAELEIIKIKTNRNPVLLLDDVMSELDINRRQTLLESIGDAQVILTCTDKSHVADEFIKSKPDKTISFYEIKEGIIKRDQQ